MPEASRGQRGLPLVARLRRLSEALALAPEHADDGMLLGYVAQEIVPVDASVVGLLMRDPAGSMRLAAVAPADGAVAEALSLAQADSVGDLTDAQLRVLAENAGLASASAVPVVAAAGSDDDVRLLIGRGEGHAAVASDQDDLLMIVGALLGAARAVRAGRRREAHLREQIEQHTRDGRELAHRLNNDLTMPVGVIELLMDRSSLDPDLRDMLRAAAHDLGALEQHIRAFHGTMRAQAATESPSPTSGGSSGGQ